MQRVTKKPEIRRREIVLASKALFLEKGYDNTSIQDVMNLAMIAKGTTYHYFKSKEDLLEAVVDEMVSAYASNVEQSLNECSGPALDKMKTLIDAGRVAPDQPEEVKALHKSGNIGLHTRLLGAIITKLAPLYAQVIEQGRAEGIFATDHPLESAEMLLAGIQFITDQGCCPWTESSLNRRLQAIPAILENLLKAPKGSFDSMFQ